MYEEFFNNLLIDQFYQDLFFIVIFQLICRIKVWTWVTKSTFDKNISYFIFLFFTIQYKSKYNVFMSIANQI